MYEKAKIQNDIYNVWLSSIYNLSVECQIELINEYKDAKEVFVNVNGEEFFNILKKFKTSEKTYINLKRKDLSLSEKIIQDCEERKIDIVSFENEEYPDILKEIPDWPLVFYKIGELSSLDCVAIVGARKGSHYGKWAAKAISEKLAEYNIQVVSGMAYGIDSAAHIGALEACGRTIAVLGSGPDICYPEAHRELYEEIKIKGTIISEYPPGTLAMPFNFPRRNRIISGLSKAVIITEAGLNSGSLITAEYANAQNKEVYALPGNINSIYSLGTNKLIKDGANLLIRIEDIIIELGIQRNINLDVENLGLGKDEKAVYNAILINGEMTVDAISKDLEKPVSQVKAIVSILEIKGFLESALGKIFIA